jgi:hypothetical protein
VTAEERRRLAGLAGLAGMIRDRDLARLADLGAQARAVQERIDGQAQAVARRSAELAASGGDAALAAGADARWQAHLDRERTALIGRLAQIMARRESARMAAAKALGRADVLDKLAGRSG